MSGVLVGHRAVGLAWLRPSHDALLALTADPPDLFALASDPAALALVLRFARPTPDATQFALTPQLLTQPSLCTVTADLLEQAESTLASWEASGPLGELARLGETAATLAAAQAIQSGACSPDAAAATARLAPLGWYAVAAIDPDTAADCLGTRDPEATQKSRWGLSASAITRRLAARWCLPPWVASVIGNLRLAPEDAVRLGAPEGLFRIVLAAVARAEQEFGEVGLTDTRTLPPDFSLDLPDLRLVEASSGPERPSRPSGSDAPTWLMVRLLRTAAVARRVAPSRWLAEAEERVDRLTSALAEFRAEQDLRVRDAKLASLAEFAAGASHEINNPLAVISGHAQLLLNDEEDSTRRSQLEAIIRQTRRVHELLQGTLQFARPPRPASALVRVSDWLAEVVATHQVDARAKNLTLSVVPLPCGEGWGHFDAAQMKQALSHLIRNAIEATTAGGWVRVQAEQSADSLSVVVEDSGPGPAPQDIEHLFDPFFSGRSAGRGRGLGLPIAWQLARVNGGEIRFIPGSPTRFLLTLPRGEVALHRKSA